MLKKSNIKNNQVFCTTCTSPLGDIMLASDGENLLGLWLEGQKYHGDSLFQSMMPISNLSTSSQSVSNQSVSSQSVSSQSVSSQSVSSQSLFEDCVKNKSLAVFEQTKNWLERYFAGEQPAITELSLAPIGSEFRQLIWKYLCQIPYGETTTYGALAKQVAAELGKTSMSAQAVGGAVGHNPISIIIPCHRVVGANGSMTGYAGGVEKKIWLLEHEHAEIAFWLFNMLFTLCINK